MTREEARKEINRRPELVLSQLQKSKGGKTFATLSNAVQYPLFTGNMRRIKSAGNSGANTYAWWLSTASTKDARQWCYVAAKGAASGGKATDVHYVPVCFRVMA